MANTFLVTETPESVATKLPESASTGSRIFRVSGTGTTQVNGENWASAPGLPAINSSYSATRTDLKCSGLTPEVLSIGMVQVTANYAVGNFQETPSNDPLQVPMTMDWSVTTQEFDTETDITGNWLVNRNHDPIKGFKKSVKLFSLVITKNLAVFDFDAARMYQDSVNDSSVTIGGMSVPAGYGKCSILIPANSVKTTDNYVTIKAQFDIWGSNAPSNPWQYRTINAGSNACYTHPETGSTVYNGRIVRRSTGQPVDYDVRLNDSGIPMDTTDLGVFRGKGKTIATSFAACPTVPAGISLINMTSCWHIQYPKYYVADWTYLFAYLGL